MHSFVINKELIRNDIMKIQCKMKIGMKHTTFSLLRKCTKLTKFRYETNKKLIKYIKYINIIILFNIFIYIVFVKYNNLKSFQFCTRKN